MWYAALLGVVMCLGKMELVWSYGLASKARFGSLSSVLHGTARSKVECLQLEFPVQEDPSRYEELVREAFLETLPQRSARAEILKWYIAEANMVNGKAKVELFFVDYLDDHN